MNGKRKAVGDKDKVFLPADKGRIMVVMDRWEKDSGEDSYEYKMKQVLVDLKATPLMAIKNILICILCHLSSGETIT